jgi:hypothetical protein
MKILEEVYVSGGECDQEPVGTFDKEGKRQGENLRRKCPP